MTNPPCPVDAPCRREDCRHELARFRIRVAALERSSPRYDVHLRWKWRDDPRGRPPPRPRPGEPKVEVAYDRSRHVIQIKEPGGKVAEFDDRPVRFLLMIRDPETKALKPVIEWGKPVYYYPAREVGGEKQAVGRGGVRARPRMNADRMGE